MASLLVPADALAQRGRGGGGRGGGTVRSAPVGRAVPRGAVPVYRGGYRGHRPIYFARPAFWGGWGWGGGWGGWGAWGWGPGWWGPGFASSLWWPGMGWWGGPALYAPPMAAWGITSDARFLVQPRNTEVYIDGALAGIVDQYDGVFQSLTLAPGTHEVSLYLDGHQRYSSNVYVAPGSTLKLRHTMQPLPPGAPADERPTPPARPQPTAQESAPDNTPAPPPTGSPSMPSESRSAVAGEAGLLVIRVQPTDAEVLVDGQRWQTDGQQPLELRVPAGRVRIEVRKPGHTPYSSEVTVQPGQVTPVNVSLPARGQQI